MAHHWRPTHPARSRWTTLEQEVPVSPWIAQPDGKYLGLGRHWHFVAATFWLLNGVVYIALLFATGERKRLIPTSWSIFPVAWHTFLTGIARRKPRRFNGSGEAGLAGL